MTTYTKETAARDLSDIVAIYFAGVAKTQTELRAFIAGMVDAMPPQVKLTAAQAEALARDNEAKQGVKMF
jgi:hypothetical protein